ncbi:MAG TPA: hypothetical protein VFU13_13725 [Steroidobacteraceae bacterium]|nr:hypothetical protein [Steroidobacteraceae bacterium]
MRVGKASVALDWSPGWQLDPNTAALPPESAAFNTADATKMRALLSTGPMREEISTDAGIRAIASDMAVKLEGQSVEKKIEVQRVEGEHARGYYVCATDRAPKAREYKYMCQGLVSVDGTPIVFTLLYNDPGKIEADKVIAAMKTMQLSAKT